MNTHSYIHYRYGIAFLIASLIAAVAFSFFDIPALVEKVTFALTITSLVLAVVAIIYTFVVTNRQDSQLSQLVLASTNISAASNEIKTVAISIGEQAREIPTRLASIDAKVGTLSAAPADLNPETDANQLPTYTREQFRRFFTSLRYAGMATLHLYVYAFKRSKPITRSMTDESIGAPSFEIVVGILSGIEASGLIKFSLHKGELIPTHCESVVTDNTETFLRQIIESLGESGETLKGMVEKIDAFVNQ